MREYELLCTLLTPGRADSVDEMSWISGTCERRSIVVGCIAAPDHGLEVPNKDAF